LVNYFSSKCQEIAEERAFRKRFHDKDFFRVDNALKRKYYFKSPYKISKQYLESIGSDDLYQYGETPLKTIYQIASSANIKKTDHLFELGAGRGRTSFFLHHFFKCQVTAIEQIDHFVKTGNEIAQKFSQGVQFRCENFLQTNFDLATVIYLYGTCLQDKVIYQLCNLIPEGVKVISVSYPLRDYDRRFKVLKKIQAEYPWGRTEVYISK